MVDLSSSLSHSLSLSLPSSLPPISSSILTSFLAFANFILFYFISFSLDLQDKRLLGSWWAVLINGSLFISILCMCYTTEGRGGGEEGEKGDEGERRAEGGEGEREGKVNNEDT